LFKYIFSIKFLVQVILAICLFFGVIYFVNEKLLDYTLQGKSTNLPNYTGFLIEDLDALVKKDGFKYLITDSSFNKNRKPGEVLSQIPLPGSLIKPGRTIYFSVNAKNTPKVQVPKLEGLSRRQAANILNTLGFKVGDESFQPDICVGCVVEATYKDKTLAKGTLLLKGSTIDLVYGMGTSNEKIPVPELLGLTYEQAKIRLKNNILKTGAVTFLNAESNLDSINSFVIRQNPVYGIFDEINLGMPVDIWLSKDTIGLNLPKHTEFFNETPFDPNAEYEETPDIPSELPDTEPE